MPPQLLAGVCRASLLVGCGLLAMSASGQEALRSSLAGAAAAEAGRLQADATPYTYKQGDFRLLVTPSVGLEWNDNVDLSQGQAEDDFILRPRVDLAASYPLTQRNLLQINVSVGYQQYFKHEELSAWYLGANSGLSFDVSVKDWLFNLHDWFSYSLDGTQRGEVAGTGNYGQFQNTAGISGTWDLEDVVPTLGYDHQNVSSLSRQFEQQDHTSEMFLSRVGVRLHPRLTVGVEGTASLTTYAQSLLNDNTAYSGGVYGDYHPSTFFKVEPRLGYALYTFEQTSRFTPAQDVNGWYADLTVSHQPTAVVSYGLSVGHQLQLGIYSDMTESWYVRPSANWGIIKDVALNASLFYEHGTLQGGKLAGPYGGIPEDAFDQYGGGLGLAYSPTRKLMTSLIYRVTFRASNVAYREYAQNLVGLTLTYTP